MEQKKSILSGLFGLKRRVTHVLIALLALALLGTGLYISRQLADNRNREAEITALSTLEEIIDVSELSTFTAVYNGVVPVYSSTDPEALDYYVSYESRVRAGIDFRQVTVEADRENKVIRITLPRAEIQAADVDMGSMDFLFYNDRANRPSVSGEAYHVCVEDVQRESSAQGAILELAQQNAANVIRALTSPYIDSFYPGYRLEIGEEAQA